MKKDDIWLFAKLGFGIAVYIAVLINLYQDYSWELSAINVWLGYGFILLFLVIGVSVRTYLKNEEKLKRN